LHTCCPGTISVPRWANALSHYFGFECPCPSAFVNCGATQLTTTDAAALPTVASTAQCTDSALTHETVLSQGAVATTVAPVRWSVLNITSNTTITYGTTSTSSSCVNAAPSAALSTPAPIEFKQLTQPRAYNGTTTWKDYRAHSKGYANV